MSETWCPSCGPDVQVDEEGCCSSCGATATGEGAELAHRITRALIGMVKAENLEELEQMELGIRTMPAPEEDKTDALNAVHALRIIYQRRAS